MTQNRIVENTSNGLLTAAAWTDSSWGTWVQPVWSGPATSFLGTAIPGWVVNDTWNQWANEGTNWLQHSDQWFRTSVNIPANWLVTSAQITYKKDNNYLPINDDLYVFVDTTYAAGGGTAGVGWVQGMLGGQIPPNPSVGSFVPAIADFIPYASSNGAIAPETWWYLSSGLSLPASLFTAGSHDIHVLGEEFDAGGGMGHLVINITYDLVTLTTLTPPEAFNPVGTQHTVTATVSPAVAGVPVTFTVTGANPQGPTVVNTNASGIATFTYTGNNPGTDTITATVGDVTLTVTKYWTVNFVTGGADIKPAKGKPTWNMTGNVGFLSDGTIVGNFHIKDFVTGNQYKCHNDFTSLVFSGPPTTSPPASHNTATFTGNFTDKNGNVVVLTIVITDNHESGGGADTIGISGLTGFPGTLAIPVQVSNGNYQVHDGFK